MLSEIEVLSKKWHQKDATSLVAKLGKSSQWIQILRLIQLAREPDSIFLSAAISALGRARRWEAALAVFADVQSVQTASGKTWGAIMSVCERSDQWQLVIQFFNQMSSQSIERSIVTFTTAIKACKVWTTALDYLHRLDESALQPDVLLYTAVLNTIASGSTGRWEAAVSTLDDMARHTVRADSYMYGAMIKCCDTGQWAMALHFLQKSPWDVLTFNAGLNLCAKAGKWQICLHTFNSMMQKDVVSYSICISSFEKSSQWEHAVGLLQDMLRSKVEPSEVSFNAAISTCKSQMQIALGLFEDMELLKVQRSIVTFNAALTACDKGWQEALHLMEKLRQDGLDLDPITLSGILTACESVWAVSLHVLDSYLAKGKVPHGLHAGSVLKAMSSSRQWHSALALLQDLRSIWENERKSQIVEISQRSQSVSKAAMFPMSSSNSFPDFKSWHEFWPSGSLGPISSISSVGGSTDLTKSTKSTKSTNTLCDVPITPIIYRKDDFMAVSKPAGVSTEQTLQILADQFSTCIFSMSRLDLPTSGILPVVVGQEASVPARWFLSQFAGTLVSKEYICLCNGRFEPLIGQIDLPLRIEATSSSTSRAVVSENVASAYKACTDYEVVAILQKQSGSSDSSSTSSRTSSTSSIRSGGMDGMDGMDAATAATAATDAAGTSLASQSVSLVRAWPQTGRLHQIRAHMAAKGFPIVGDTIYSGAAMWPWCKRLFLHCRRLRLFGFDGPIELKAELPQELKDALGVLEIQTEVPQAMREAMHQAMRDILEDQGELGTGNNGCDDTSTGEESEESEERKAFKALIQCQEMHMEKILEELDRGAKESHWAWYIFPTTRAGNNDPYKTHVTEENANELCNQPTAKDWQKCLEKICDLLEACNRPPRPPGNQCNQVLPECDHDRVRYFIKFWQNYSKSPGWLMDVCQRLQDLQF
eukprot:s206_g36.t1